MQLSDGLRSRANNYNLIRLLAASLVMFSHAFTVVTGRGELEPLRASLDLTWGAISVDVFFVISGLLVTSSMRRSDSALDFCVSRALRILPGLVVSLALMALVASAVFWRTVDARDAVSYVARNALPMGAMHKAIDGVFVDNPAGAAFNASLWTLPVEVHMYLYVFVMWLASFAFLRHRRLAFDVMIVLAAAYYAVCHLGLSPRESVETAPYRLYYMFLVGGAALIVADRIRLHWAALVVALGAILVSALVDRSAFFICYSLGLWYVVLGLAYLPRGRILGFNRLGDYSYGVYIYAWPVQQLAIALLPGLNVATHLLLTAPVVLGLAMLSWRFVEAPALRLKKRIIRRPAGAAPAHSG